MAQPGDGDCGTPFNANVAVAKRLPVTVLDPPCTYRGPVSGAINTSAEACEIVESVEIAAPAAGSGVATIVGNGDGDGDGAGTALAAGDADGTGACGGVDDFAAGGAADVPPPPHAHSAVRAATTITFTGRMLILRFSSVVVWEISLLCKGNHNGRVEV